MACGFGIIKTSVAIGLQSHGEFVEMLGDLVVAVEVLVEVDFVVAVQVVEPDDLIAAGDMNFFINDFEAERLKETGGDALPAEMISSNAAHEPDFAQPGAHCGGIVVAEKVEAAKAHP